MDNTKLKQAILVVVISITIFAIFKPKENDAASKDSSKKTYKKPKLTDEELSSPIIEDAYVALCAYIDAYNDGVSQKKLDELNAEIGKKMDLQVVKVSPTELAIEDMKGNEIISVIV